MTVQFQISIIPNLVQWLHKIKEYKIFPNDIFTEFNENQLLGLQDVKNTQVFYHMTINDNWDTSFM
jgi:hypothetical protein